MVISTSRHLPEELAVADSESVSFFNVIGATAFFKCPLEAHDYETDAPHLIKLFRTYTVDFSNVQLYVLYAYECSNVLNKGT